MSFFKDIFKKKSPIVSPLLCDMHNHILFGIDDGSKTIENSIEMIVKMMELGYKKLIFTPHIISDYYPNTIETISEPFFEIKNYLKANNIDIEIEFAAEHLIDDNFVFNLSNSTKKILCFDDKKVLIETPFINQPNNLQQVIFDLINKGYEPILAHPERYVYLQCDYQLVETIFNTGVKFQINLLSLVSYYSPQATKLAKYLIDNNYYHYLGTDAHKIKHIEMLKDVYSTKIFSKIDFTRVENNQLIGK